MSDELLSSLAIKHHFGAGTYVKETHIRAGYALTQHKHTFDHLAILGSGEAAVVVSGTVVLLKAPCVVNIRANVQHRVEAITDCAWFCIHATEERDVTKIDKLLISPVR